MGRPALDPAALFKDGYPSTWGLDDIGTNDETKRSIRKYLSEIGAEGFLSTPEMDVPILCLKGDGNVKIMMGVCSVKLDHRDVIHPEDDWTSKKLQRFPVLRRKIPIGVYQKRIHRYEH